MAALTPWAWLCAPPRRDREVSLVTEPGARPACGHRKGRPCPCLPQALRVRAGSGFSVGQLSGVAAQPGAENGAALRQTGAPWHQDYIPNPERSQGIFVAGFAAMWLGTEHRGCTSAALPTRKPRPRSVWLPASRLLASRETSLCPQSCLQARDRHVQSVLGKTAQPKSKKPVLSVVISRSFAPQRCLAPEVLNA